MIDYFILVRAYPLVSLETDGQLARAKAVLNNIGTDTIGQRRYRDTLETLILYYESRKCEPLIN